MTTFNLTKDEQGDWYAYFDSHVDPIAGETIYDTPEEGAAEFRIRSMAPFFEEQRKGRKKEHKMVLNPSTRQMERVGYYPDLPDDIAAQENDDAWDYSITGIKNAFSAPKIEIECTRENAITGIKNAFSAPKIEIECTRENKLALIEIPAFLRFIFRVFQIISDTGVKDREGLEKN